MEDLPFIFNGTTRGHSLNMVEIEPQIVKALKAHCTKVKGHPVQVHVAQYDFGRDRSNKPKTFYHIDIEVEDGKGDVSVDNWLKASKQQHSFFKWSFGMPSEDEREV